MMGTPVWGSGPSFVLTESGGASATFTLNCKGDQLFIYMPFQMSKFWSSRLRRPNTSGKIWELLQATQTSGVQSAAAQCIGGQESTAVRLLGTNGPTKRLSLLHPFAVFNCFFLGGPASLTLAMPEFETKCLHVDTVSEVEHPGLASWSLVAKKGQL